MSRRIAIILLSAALSACGSSEPETPEIDIETPPPLASDVVADTGPEYEAGWNTFDYWSGEYPNGFVIEADGVEVMGRKYMHPDAAAEIVCPLPKGANYTLWNGDRVVADDLDFKSTVFQTGITMTADASLETYTGETPVQLDLKAGDELIYKLYMAEGFFLAEFEGVEYELEETQLNDIAEFETGPPDLEWVNVKCYDEAESRAWLLNAEVIEEDGIGMTNYDSYGEASDTIFP